MKVKIARATLIKRLSETRKERLRRHAEAVAAYPRLELHYRAELVRALREAAARLEAGGKLPPTGSALGPSGRRFEGVVIRTRRPPPQKPARPDTKRLDARLRVLGLISTDELVIDPQSPDWLGVL